MKTELAKLVTLSAIDATIDHLMEQQETLPQTITELESQLLSLAKELSAKKADLTSLESQKNQKEQDLIEQRDWIIKREIQQKEIKTNKEYHAAVKEITLAKKKITDAEQAVSQLSASMEAEIPKISDFEKETSQKQNSIQQLIGEKKSQIESLASQILEQTKKRAEVERELKDAVLKRYKAIKNKLSPAMAEARGGGCLECNTTIPPQLYIELQKYQQIVNCPRCHRILYLQCE